MMETLPPQQRRRSTNAAVLEQSAAAQEAMERAAEITRRTSMMTELFSMIDERTEFINEIDGGTTTKGSKNNGNDENHNEAAAVDYTTKYTTIQPSLDDLVDVEEKEAAQAQAEAANKAREQIKAAKLAKQQKKRRKSRASISSSSFTTTTTSSPPSIQKVGELESSTQLNNVQADAVVASEPKPNQRGNGCPSGNDKKKSMYPTSLNDFENQLERNPTTTTTSLQVDDGENDDNDNEALSSMMSEPTNAIMRDCDDDDNNSKQLVVETKEEILRNQMEVRSAVGSIPKDNSDDYQLQQLTQTPVFVANGDLMERMERLEKQLQQEKQAREELEIKLQKHQQHQQAQKESDLLQACKTMVEDQIQKERVRNEYQMHLLKEENNALQVKMEAHAKVLVGQQEMIVALKEHNEQQRQDSEQKILQLTMDKLKEEKVHVIENKLRVEIEANLQEELQKHKQMIQDQQEQLQQEKKLREEQQQEIRKLRPILEGQLEQGFQSVVDFLKVELSKIKTGIATVKKKKKSKKKQEQERSKPAATPSVEEDVPTSNNTVSTMASTETGDDTKKIEEGTTASASELSQKEDEDANNDSDDDEEEEEDFDLMCFPTMSSSSTTTQDDTLSVFHVLHGCDPSRCKHSFGLGQVVEDPIPRHELVPRRRQSSSTIMTDHRSFTTRSSFRGLGKSLRSSLRGSMIFNNNNQSDTDNKEMQQQNKQQQQRRKRRATAPAAAATLCRLPLGWEAHFDPDQQKHYYVDTVRGTSQWQMPQ